VYFARLDPPETQAGEQRNPRLLGIVRGQISDIGIGPGKPSNEALDEADLLAEDFNLEFAVPVRLRRRVRLRLRGVNELRDRPASSAGTWLGRGRPESGPAGDQGERHR
jgi:hypothetical protein